VWIIGTTSTNISVMSPSALVSNDDFYGTTTGVSTSGGNVILGPKGLYSVGLYLYGTRTSPSLGQPALYSSGCTWFPMDNFVFPSQSNYGMGFLIDTDSDVATIRCNITPGASQTIEAILVVCRLQ